MHELNRYLRQINLPGVGVEGQKKLKDARVLCVGAGGLGSPLLLYLAAAGVGTLGVIDHDRVEVSNLHRQILYQQQHIGHEKVSIAQQQMIAANPHIKVNAYAERFNLANAEMLVKEYDIVADCSDNFSTRYLVNDVCVKLQKPFVFASVAQFEGLCSTFLGQAGPCYRCLFPSPPADEVIPNCEEGGVLGVLPGLLGVIQAAEVLKLILVQGDLLVGRVLAVNMLTMCFQEFRLPPNPHCNIGVHPPMIRSLEQAVCRSKQAMNNDYLISPQELKAALENNEDIQLVDVRTAEKHHAFNIGGLWIPMEELPQRLGELDPEKVTVTYCTMGGRSMRALEFLVGAGFRKVRSLDGGMTAWREVLV